jgi:hypothetical protein
MVDDQEVNWDRNGEGIYRIDLDFQERAVLELKF